MYPKGRKSARANRSYFAFVEKVCILNQPLSSDALAQLFTEARTFNGYLDKPVPVEMLHALWDLMKMGPTSANQLPARIVWCVSQEAKDKLAALARSEERRVGKEGVGTCRSGWSPDH